MTKCSGRQLVFKGCFGRKVVADFRGGAITSDAGGVLLREADRRLGLTEALAGCIEDHRQPGKVIHSTLQMLRQRVYGIALGYVKPVNIYNLTRTYLILFAFGFNDSVNIGPPNLDILPVVVELCQESGDAGCLGTPSL